MLVISMLFWEFLAVAPLKKILATPLIERQPKNLMFSERFAVRKKMFLIKVRLPFPEI